MIFVWPEIGLSSVRSLSLCVAAGFPAYMEWTLSTALYFPNIRYFKGEQHRCVIGIGAQVKTT